MDKKNLELAIDLRHRLHAHPELSGQETWTRHYLMEFLKKHTQLEIVDCGKWFYAHYSSNTENPSIAFRADFDALPIDETISLPYGSCFPGISHKCGHDGHSATLCALALEIDRTGADRDIYFIFQHAEETGAGAIECAPLIDEEKISEIFAYHNMPGYPEGTVAVRKGTMNCASQGMIIHFKGAPAHASLPENGRNPALSIADLIRLIPELTDAASYKGMVLATIVHVHLGEEAFGMAAGEGRLLLTCRAQYEKDLNALSEKLEKKAEEFAERDGLKVTISYKDIFPETVNDGAAVDKILKVCHQLDIPVEDMPDPQRGSEDMGHFLKRTSGAMFLMGIGNRPPVHDEHYDFYDGIIEPVVEIFTALIKNR